MRSNHQVETLPPRPDHGRRVFLRCFRGRGFSLIELLVVISLAAVLLTLGVIAGNAMRDRAEAGLERSVLIGLSGAVDEYATRVGRPPDHTDLSVPGLAVSSDDAQDSTIGLFLSKAHQLGEDASVWKMITSATRDGLVIGDGTDVTTWSYVDMWGGKLRYARRVSHTDAFAADDYLPAHPAPFFASAGPDGAFGDYQQVLLQEAGQPHDADAARATQDNLYSFDIE